MITVSLFALVVTAIGYILVAPAEISFFALLFLSPALLVFLVLGLAMGFCVAKMIGDCNEQYWDMYDEFELVPFRDGVYLKNEKELLGVYYKFQKRIAGCIQLDSIYAESDSLFICEGTGKIRKFKKVMKKEWLRDFALPKFALKTEICIPPNAIL